MLQSRMLLCAATAAAASTPASARSHRSGGGESAWETSAGGTSRAFCAKFHSFAADTPQAQREALRQHIRMHEAAVQRNAERHLTCSSTYSLDTCMLFPFYQLGALPPTSGGAFHANIRAALSAADGPLCEMADSLLRPWQAAGERAVVVFGAKSIPYLRRQLAADESHSFLVIDHSLKALANAAAALVKDFGPRVHFLRTDAMFAVLSVLPREAVDTVVAPMPAPFWSEKGSYRRLVTSNFLCAAHRVLRERTDAADPRGLVTFTDCEPYADFMVEQLTEAKLVVPWTRKNPHEAYARWLPLSTASGGTEDTSTEAADVPSAFHNEFPQQRFRDVVAVAASKSGPTSPQALALVEGYDYKRRYYRAFNDGSA